MHALRKALSLAGSSSLLILLATGVADMQAPPAGVGDTIVVNGIRVTLLDARPLTSDEYRAVAGDLAGEWAGGGFRFAFLTENRPGASIGPALGDVRVFVGSRPYNAVVNPMSRRPFAPDVEIRTISDFFATRHGRTISERGPAPRAGAGAHVLDVLVRGASVPDGSPVVVELEQGETHRPDATGRLRELSPAEMGATWTPFRFIVAPLR
jgi:hypothetical protein